MTCADLEVFICDYVDGTLTPVLRVEVEHHLAECPACAELARDSSAAVAFMGRVTEVEAPPELLTRIFFQAPWHRPGPGKAWDSGSGPRECSIRSCNRAL